MAIDAEMRLGALVLLAALAVAGCRKKEEPPADPYNEPYARLQDPEYQKALEQKRQEQKEILKRLAAAKAAYDAANAEDPDSPKTAELKKALVAVQNEMEKNRLLSQTLVRDRLNQENQAIKAKQEASKQKGK